MAHPDRKADGLLITDLPSFFLPLPLAYLYGRVPLSPHSMVSLTLTTFLTADSRLKSHQTILTMSELALPPVTFICLKFVMFKQLIITRYKGYMSKLFNFSMYF